MSWEALGVSFGILAALVTGLVAVLRLTFQLGRYADRVESMLNQHAGQLERHASLLQDDHEPRIFSLEEFRRTLRPS